MDIVKWLREYGWRNGTKTCGDRHDEAADEIERLHSSKMLQLKLAEIKQTELDRLREALQKILNIDNFENIFEIAESALKETE